MRMAVFLRFPDAAYESEFPEHRLQWEVVHEHIWSIRMVTEPSGVVLAVMVTIGPLLLLAALIFGVVVYRRRRTGVTQLGKQQTRRLYNQEDR